jgi:hypothetical protein
MSWCPTCGCAPCPDPGFCRLCRDADRRLAADRRETGDVEVARPAPAVTVEAVLYSIRARGAAALKKPDVIERLNRCDTTAKAEINRRIERFREKGELT